MKGAKPSSGLVHLHKSFVELHFSGRLPQNVSIVPCVDGITLETVLPGQVYSTSCGQDHWLLGLQFIFKAYKEPVITHVEKTGDSQITVAIATQGLQDKYTSDDPEQRAELQRAMEAAALKFAQAAVMRKAGRLQVSGPNINIPKKQLRAQWPAVLERLAPQDVTAHIFVDSTDAYIACAAKIILTKAKAEPVFYLSGLSQLLKSFMGAYVTMELMPNEHVVRLNIDTGKSRQESMSTRAAAAAGTASQADQAEASSTAVQQICASTKAAATATERGERKRSRSSQSGDAGSGAFVPAAAATMAAAATPQRTSARATSAAAATACISVVKSSAVSTVQQTRDNGKSPAVDAADAPRMLLKAAPPTARLQQQQQQQQQVLEGMVSSNVGAMRGDSTPCRAVQQMGLPVVVVSADNSNCSSLQPPASSSSGHMTGYKQADVQAEAVGPVSLAAPATLQRVRTVDSAAGGDTGAVHATEPAHTMDGPASCGITPGSDAGLRLLADHAAQLQALGSTGNLSSAAAAAVAALPVARRQRRQHSSASRLEGKAQPVRRASSTAAEVLSPAEAAAASSNPPVQVKPILLDPAAAAAAVPVSSAVVASAAMAAAALPAVAAGLQAMGTSCCGYFGAEAGAMLASAEHAVLAAQHSVGFTAAAVGARGKANQARVSSAAGAAMHVEQDCSQLESWPMYAKRHRTAHAAEARDCQQHQQDYHGVLPGRVLGADMGYSAVYDRGAAAIGQYWHWDAAAMAARTDGGVHNVLHPDTEALAFQHQQHKDFLKELQYSQHQQEQEQMLVSGAYLLAPAAVAPGVASAGEDVFVSHNDDVRALAQQHADQHGLGGAVAVVTRMSSNSSLAAHTTQLQQQKLDAIRAFAELEAAMAAQQQQQMYWQGAAAHWHPAAMPVDSKASIVGPGAVDTAGYQLTAGAVPAESVVATHTTSQGAIGLQPSGGCAIATLPELSPAKQPYLNSPGSNASSVSRVPVSQGGALDSTLASCSPALAAVHGASTVAAAAAAGASGIAISSGASIALAADAGGMGCGAVQALQLQQPADQRCAAFVREPNAAAGAGAGAGAAPNGLRSAAGDTAKLAGSCSSIEGEAQPEQPKQLMQQSPLSMHNQTMAAAVDQSGRQLVTAVLAAAAAAAPDGLQQQQQAMQLAPGDPAAATVCPDGWPILPDADKLLAVGKALVQVMNLLGAGSEARLVLTRALRTMSPHDREWLLSITYPHLQDSCRRRAVPEMRMILNEVAGMDCFADAGAPPAGTAGGVGAGRAC